MWEPWRKSNQVGWWFIWLILSIISPDNLHIKIMIITFNPISTCLAKFSLCAIFSWHSLYAYRYKYAFLFCFCPPTTKGYCTWENLELLIETLIYYSMNSLFVLPKVVPYPVYADKKGQDTADCVWEKALEPAGETLRSCDTVANRAPRLQN